MKKETKKLAISVWIKSISSLFLLIAGLVSLINLYPVRASYLFLSNQEKNKLYSETPTPTLTPTPEVQISSEDAVIDVPIIKNTESRREFNAEEYLNDSLGSKDIDCDGVANIDDNCLLVYNPDQKKTFEGDDGDACNATSKNYKKMDRHCDIDKDGIYDDSDNCPTVCNPNQKDKNKDGLGDACDARLVNLDTAERICKTSNSSLERIKKSVKNCQKTQ